ncbi:DNA binding domain, excisionase family [Mycobacteroides abscessus subsp. abscessus]|nr:DNA binding domain, excisionase family [Mycobacteroides abscessus subsp. abscessus]
MTTASDIRHAHHEAGHAVAAVHRGGFVQEVQLAGDDPDDIGYVKHWSSPANAPFVTFAGPWAEAKWDTMTEPDTTMDEALDLAWAENCDGDTDKYNALVDQLQAAADELGLGPIGAAWETDWQDELDELWPWIRCVAAELLDGVVVDHERIVAAKERAERAQRVPHARPAPVAREPELLTRAAAARRLGVAPRTVTRLIAEGRLRTETVDGKVFPRPEWIAEAKAAGLGGRGDWRVPAGMLTVSQAAARAGVSQDRVRAAIETGVLVAHRGGTEKRTVWGIRVEDLDGWVTERAA